MKALIVGKSSYSFVSTVDAMPFVNSENVYTNVVDGVSGFVPLSGILLGKFGIETYCASVCGDDTFGTTIKKELEKANVHTEAMETAYDKRTHMCFVTYNKNDKSKIVCNLEKEQLFLKKNDFTTEPDIILTDGYDYAASLAAFNKYPGKKTIISAIYPKQELFELAKYCEYIIVSQAFAEGVSGDKMDFSSSQTLLNNFKVLYGKFPKKNVIVNLEDKGVIYIKDNQIKLMPPLKVEVVNKSKCYDIFAAAFAYALACGYNDIEKAITFGICTSSLAMSLPGTAEVPAISDVMVEFGQKYPDAVTSVNSNGDAPTAEDKPSETAPAEAPKEEAKPVEASNPVEEPKPVEPAPVEPPKEETPAITEPAPVEEVKPAEVAPVTDVPTPVEEAKPAEGTPAQ